MTVVSSWNCRPKPGRQDAAIALLHEASKLIERHGGHEIRVLQAAVAGAATGSISMSCEFADLTAYGTFTDETARDVETATIVNRSAAVDSPITPESAGVWTEIPLDRRGGNGRGPVVAVYFTKAVPGRLNQALQLASDAFDLLEAGGGLRSRILQATMAGEQADMYVSVIEYESNRAFGAASDSLMASPKGQKLMDTMNSKECPIVNLGSHLYTEIQL
jgi:hypothetical protein